MREAAVVAPLTDPSAVQHLAGDGFSSAYIVRFRSGDKGFDFFLLSRQFVKKCAFFSFETSSL